MANNRVFYACQAVAIAPCFEAATNANTRAIHGLQSVGITTNFNLEQAFELGQIQIYENIEGLPDVEVTLEKVLDGHPLIYHLASPGATVNSLVNRSKLRSCVALGIYPDDQDAVTGDAPAEVYMSGMYLSSISYTIPADGTATESVTLVGNDKKWTQRTGLTGPTLMFANTAAELPEDGDGKGTDAPKNLASTGSGVVRRENVDLDKTILPAAIFGAVGTGAGNAKNAGGDVVVHIQNFTCSTDFGREDILELGRKAPYYRAPNFPIEVTSEFEVIAVSGDFVNCAEGAASNTNEETIKVVLGDDTSFDLGSKNRLSSVSYGGGDAAGGNATITYSYSTFNDLTVSSPEDPAGL